MIILTKITAKKINETLFSLKTWLPPRRYYYKYSMVKKQIEMTP